MIFATYYCSEVPSSCCWIAFVESGRLLQNFNAVGEMSPVEDLELLLCESFADLCQLPNHPLVPHDCRVVRHQALPPLLLHLGPHRFDWIENRRGGWQEEQAALLLLNHFLHFLTNMGAVIVRHDY